MPTSTRHWGYGYVKNATMPKRGKYPTIQHTLRENKKIHKKEDERSLQYNYNKHGKIIDNKQQLEVLQGNQEQKRKIIYHRQTQTQQKLCKTYQRVII